MCSLPQGNAAAQCGWSRRRRSTVRLREARLYCTTFDRAGGSTQRSVRRSLPHYGGTVPLALAACVRKRGSMSGGDTTATNTHTLVTTYSSALQHAQHVSTEQDRRECCSLYCPLPFCALQMDAAMDHNGAVNFISSNQAKELLAVQRYRSCRERAPLLSAKPATTNQVTTQER